MKEYKITSGFSRLNKDQKIDLVASKVPDPELFGQTLHASWHRDPATQKMIDEFSENTLGNYFFPYGVAPNFLINGKMYMVPLVIEESSVVAAASGAAKFWAERGGFHSEIIGLEKIGQVHFTWNGGYELLDCHFAEIRKQMFANTSRITANMMKRGGGILSIELVDMTDKIPDYYQVKATFDTRDSMGANFINSCLEEFADTLRDYAAGCNALSLYSLQVVMSILSNYTPNCLVRTWVEGLITEEGHHYDDLYTDREFVARFETGVRIAQVDRYRATTHNKGIYNGIDAVVLATGNDFRAVEACGHAYASRNGEYSSLSKVEIKGNIFHFSLEVPMALGTVGGLTHLHPLAKLSLQLLGNPDAAELMMIASAAGLANNYSAVKSLVTKGIQKGHMKMHLLNILNVYLATDEEKKQAVEFFKHEKVSHSAVNGFLESIRVST
ncbi:MAG: hydroxymethylglutaryl-CoA reductase [Bacteroidales bacterium]|nr:hydroxymethylglutaryl-CoA reductase [Bacteroidales bacterium]